MIAKAVINLFVLCSMSANGICPLRENGTTVVLPFQQINIDGLYDTRIKTELEQFLASHYNFTFTPENPAASCKQIAELKPHYNSGYYWIQGESGAVEVYH